MELTWLCGDLFFLFVFLYRMQATHGRLRTDAAYDSGGGCMLLGLGTNAYQVNSIASLKISPLLLKFGKHTHYTKIRERKVRTEKVYLGKKDLLIGKQSIFSEISISVFILRH